METNKFKVTVPPNVSGGQTMRIQTPDRRQWEVKLPAPVRPGDELVLDTLTGALSVIHKQQAFQGQNYGYGYPQQHPQSQSQTQLQPQYQPNPVFNPSASQMQTQAGYGGYGHQGNSFQYQQGQSASGFGVGQMSQSYQTKNSSNSVNKLQIQVPKGVQGGQTIPVELPNGKIIELVVPFSAKSGSKIYIDANTGRIIDDEHGGATAPVAFGAQDDLPIANYVDDGTGAAGSGSGYFDFSKGGPEVAELLGPGPNWYEYRGHYHQPIPHGLRPAKVGLPPPNATGRKRALLIGINYKGSRAPLKGCVNDVYAMQKFLMNHGFTNTPHTMVLLLDNVPDPTFHPTKANIIKGMQWLVEGAQPGDSLFFHFSGHGAQQTDNTGHERDGLNETILPMDFDRKGVGMVTDDEIWEIMVAKLPSGCRLYALMDCCHCGTGMDLSYNWKNHAQWFQEPNPSFTEGDVILFSGCDDHQTSADAYSKLANAPGGAMTTSFISVYDRMRNPTLAQFLHAIHQDIKARGFRQVPQLSSSQRWEPNARTFTLQDAFFSNYNEQVGKLVTQRFKPQKPDFGNSPLGPMLLAAGFAVFVAPALLGGIADGIGGIADGIGDVGGGLFDGGGFDFGGFF